MANTNEGIDVEQVKAEDNDVPQNLQELTKPEPEIPQEPAMLGSASVDTPAAPEDFFKRLRETYANAKKAVQDFIANEKKAIDDKLAKIEALKAEIEGHNSNINDANEQLK
jgi:hypothetical protein